MTVDCMACLVALSRGLDAGGVHQGNDGITHATVRAATRAALACTLRRDTRSRELWSVARATWVPR